MLKFAFLGVYGYTPYQHTVPGIENALESLKLTHAEAQHIVHALVTILNSASPATPTSSPSTLPPSSLSETSKDPKDSDNEDQGDVLSLSPLKCPTCSLPMAATQPSFANAGSAPSVVIASTTAVAETPVPVIAEAPSAAASIAAPAASPMVISTMPTIVVPSAPAVASVLAPAAPTAPIVDNGSTSTSTVSVPAAVVAPAAAVVLGPLYNQLPPNAPSNAILPPAHLVTVGHSYHVPGPNGNPPFYVVTRGRNIGVFSGWSVKFYIISF